MGEYSIVVSDLAKQDIRDTATYIEYDLQEPKVAEKNTEAIISAILTLEDMPERIGFMRDERLASKQIRGLQVKNYTIFFRINKVIKTVEIVRVIYSRRDWAALL